MLFRYRARVRELYCGLAAFNLLAWVLAIALFRQQVALLAMAALAYSLGLRHAVDADHIAAIDNVTRKLMQAGQRPVAVGLFFSLGHSTVVLLASICVALGIRAVTGAWAPLRNLGGWVGSAISIGFLFAIALANLRILYSLRRRFEQLRQAGARPHTDASAPVHGLLARLFRPVFNLINHSWQMYPLGVLFGLGFDTASEVAVLSIAAAQAAHGMPIWSVLLFPLLFTAAMSLIDTLDSALMVSAYGWALVNPRRKLYYNMTMTAASVAIALLVGTVEALGIVADRLHGSGHLWTAVLALNAHMALLGYFIVAIFLLGWLASTAVYRLSSAASAGSYQSQ